MNQLQLIIIDSLQGIKDLEKDMLDNAEFIAYDTETTGLTQYDQVIGFSICWEETKAYYVLLSKYSPKLGTLEPILGMYEAACQLMRNLACKKIICHNGVFDCMMTEAYFKVSLINSLHTDTMVLAHLLNENRKIGLKPLGAQCFGEEVVAESEEVKASVVANGGSVTKGNYELYKGDPYLIAKYGAKDAWLTYKLFLELVPELYEQKLDQFFYEDESMPLLRGPTYELNTTGLQVDTVKMTSLKKQLQAECAEDKAFIYQEIGSKIKAQYPGTTKKNTFNIGSSQQLAWLLFGEYELEFGTMTKAGKEVAKRLVNRIPYTPAAKREFIDTCLNSQYMVYKLGGTINGKKKKDVLYSVPWKYIACDKKTLTKLAPKYKWIERLLSYQRKMKLLSTYVEGIEERTKYGIVRPSFLQTGTTSGRYASRVPNFQNLPRDDKRIKSCIVARPGKTFVGADYSQLEPRVFAYTSGDERLCAVFNGTDDFYAAIGMGVYGKYDCTPKKDGSPEAFGIKYRRLRDLSKVIALASTYGATANQLAPTTGKSIEETQEDIDSYFEQFPKVKQMMLDSHKMAKIDGQVVNLFNRPRRMPEAKRITKLYGDVAHADLPYDARNLLNLAVNHRIQSTGASIVNRAAIRFHQMKQEAGIDCKLTLQVHDSLIVECNEEDAANVAILLEEAMVNTVILKNVPLEAVPKIGTNLAEV